MVNTPGARGINVGSDTDNLQITGSTITGNIGTSVEGIKPGLSATPFGAPQGVPPPLTPLRACKTFGIRVAGELGDEATCHDLGYHELGTPTPREPATIATLGGEPVAG